MTTTLNYDGLFNSIMTLHKVLYPQKSDIVPAQNDNAINSFAKNENSVKVIFDQANFRILNISENVETILGYTQADFYNANMSLFLDLLTLDHFFFPYTWAKWGIDIYETLGVHTNMKTTLCGIKIKHRNGHIMRFLIRHSALEYFENGTIKISAMTFDDISHLIKSDFYWGRAAFDIGTNRHIQHLFSTDKKYILNDIISDREKDVLRLIVKGMESKEIAEVLFISTHTVDNHRRNLIARTGARDTTALIHICKMCGII